MLSRDVKYVNRMYNIAWLTGVVRHNPDNPRQFFLSQTNNPSLDLPIELPTPDFRLPPEGRLRTVVAHVRGRVGQYGQTAYAEALSLQDPSALNIAPLVNYLNGLIQRRIPKDKMPEGFSITGGGLIRKEFLDALREVQDLRPEEQAIIDLYEQEYGGKIRGRFESAANVVMIAGFVEKYAYVPPNQYQSHGQGLIQLRQHKSLSELVPVRVVNNKVSVILERLHRGEPIFVKGRLRRKIMPTPDGQGILSDTVMVETDMVSSADTTHILPPPPEWFTAYIKQPEQAAPEQAAA